MLRTVGFSIGSALSALVLQMNTPKGASSPRDIGYTQVAAIGIVIIMITIAILLAVHIRQLRHRKMSTDQTLSILNE